ncbi:hypothetical protein [Nonomuraea rubra]|uniref:Uncharacterized protein n=1 Tax=Nonomuraea rubra TaxID=46180 RepID=A0A7X0P113_9ACTN|nr:hypothetical protein [Nonomuraea rubra]MBB6553207.1 hypothetical protein [Nonomuraea rubra]
MKPPGRTRRGLRSALVAFGTTVIAVAAHRANHGTIPPLLALLPVVLVAWGVAYALAGRRVTRWELLFLLGAAQFGIHGLSVYLTGPVHYGAGDVSSPMVLTHAAATVLTALLLEHGERMWWGLLSLLGARYCAVRVRDLPPRVLRVVPVAFRAVLTLTRLCGGPVGTRAPPLLARI